MEPTSKRLYCIQTTKLYVQDHFLLHSASPVHHLKVMTHPENEIKHRNQNSRKLSAAVSSLGDSLS